MSVPAAAAADSCEDIKEFPDGVRTFVNGRSASRIAILRFDMRGMCRQTRHSIAKPLTGWPHARRSPVHHESAVHIDRLPGHMGRPIGGEKDDHVGDRLRGLPFAQWDERADLSPSPLLVSETIFLWVLVLPRLPGQSVERAVCTMPGAT